MKTQKRFFIVALTALILNTIWEFSHYSLYIDLSGIPKYPHLIIASFTDVLIIQGIFAIISLKNKDFKWIKSPSKLDYLFVFFIGLIVATFIELINLNLGRWAYTAVMPTIFGIGITPLIQLALTGIISLIIQSHINKDMEYSLEHVKNTYHIWGRHPILYKIACIITFLGRENKLRKLAVSVLELKKGDTALDLACGTGLNFKFLEDAIGPNGKIIAFDYSNEMLLAAKQRAKKYNWNNIIFIQGDAAQLSLNSKVDGVLSTLGISAIPQHKEALKKAFDVLKDNGIISILDAQLPSGFWSIFNPLIAYVYKHWASWDYTKNIPENLRQFAGNIKTEQYNLGTIYIVYETKNAP